MQRNQQAVTRPQLSRHGIRQADAGVARPTTFGRARVPGWLTGLPSRGLVMGRRRAFERRDGDELRRARDETAVVATAELHAEEATPQSVIERSARTRWRGGEVQSAEGQRTARACAEM